MGAATTLLYAYKDPRISAICVDSPFEDFKRLAEELVIKQIKLPKLIIDGALKIVQGTVKKKNGLDIYKLRPIDHVANTYQPALFIHAINDELINVEHSINLFNNYGGQKSLKCCDKGGHNTKRPKIVKNEIGNFFYKYLCTTANEEEKKEEKIIHNYIKEDNLTNINNNIDNFIDYEDNNIDNNEYQINEEDYQNVDEFEDENLENIYEEDYIVNQIIQSQNGGKKEGEKNINKSENINKIEEKNKGVEKSKNKKRIEKILKEEKLQMEKIKDAFKNLNINDNNKNIINESQNNIINDNNNNINADNDNNEEESKNNSNSPKSIENGGKINF
jgi:hypothetical protein